MNAGKTIDLAVMNITIPSGMGGLQAMELLRQINPGILAIVSSGNTADPAMLIRASLVSRSRCRSLMRRPT